MTQPNLGEVAGHYGDHGEAMYAGVDAESDSGT